MSTWSFGSETSGALDSRSWMGVHAPEIAVEVGAQFELKCPRRSRRLAFTRHELGLTIQLSLSNDLSLVDDDPMLQLHSTETEATSFLKSDEIVQAGALP